MSENNSNFSFKVNLLDIGLIIAGLTLIFYILIYSYMLGYFGWHRIPIHYFGFDYWVFYNAIGALRSLFFKWFYVSAIFFVIFVLFGYKDFKKLLNFCLLFLFFVAVYIVYVASVIDWYPVHGTTFPFARATNFLPIVAYCISIILFVISLYGYTPNVKTNRFLYLKKIYSSLISNRIITICIKVAFIFSLVAFLTNVMFLLGICFANNYDKHSMIYDKNNNKTYVLVASFNNKSLCYQSVDSLYDPYLHVFIDDDISSKEFIIYLKENSHITFK